MKLREVIEQLNEGLKDIKGKKYTDMSEYRDTIDDIITPILRKTELGKLLINSVGTIRLVVPKDIKCCGAGEELLTISIERKNDKRIRFGTKGTFISATAELHHKVENNLLDFELIELQPYFDKKNLKSNIEWCDKEIERLKEEILKIESERKDYQKQLSEME